MSAARTRCNRAARGLATLVLVASVAHADEPLGNTLAVKPLQTRLEQRMHVHREARESRQTDERLAQTARRPVATRELALTRERAVQDELREQKTRRVAASRN